MSAIARLGIDAAAQVTFTKMASDTFFGETFGVSCGLYEADVNQFQGNHYHFMESVALYVIIF